MATNSHLEKRMLAEWESEGAILLALPHEGTDWNYMLADALDQYRRLISTLLSASEKVLLLCNDIEIAQQRLGLKPSPLLKYLKANYNDTWTRDYGPITLQRHDGTLRTLDFAFNGWGLKFASNLDNLINLQLLTDNILKHRLYRNHLDFELEGGSIDSDGNGTILTTSQCLCSLNRNRGKSKAELNEILYTRLGATHVLWLDYGALDGDDTDSHIDTLARFAPHDTILYTGECPGRSDRQNNQLHTMLQQLTRFRTAEGNAYNLIELPCPDPIYDSDGQRLPATYANFLVTRRNVFVPTYSQPERDELARLTIASVFPQKKIFTVDCNALICQHGSLHCATMQLPQPILNY